jgi:hypothetical protein
MFKKLVYKKVPNYTCSCLTIVGVILIVNTVLTVI